MKIQLKLAASLLLAICANLSAEASQYENKQCCEPLLRDCPSWAFDCEISLLYLQPSGSNLHYVAEAEPLPVPSPSWIIDDIRPDYHFGFEAYLKVVNPCREGGVILDYTHFYSKDSDSKAVSSSDMVGPFFEIGPDALLYTSAKGAVAFHYDALNLDYSLPFNYGNCLHSNLYAGVGGARIKEHLNYKYSNADGTISRTIKSPSSFLGAGPQLGLDFSYGICNNLHLTGSGSASLLVGTLKNHTSYASYSPLLEDLDITPPNKQSTHVHDRTHVVPAFEAKLGLAYCFSYCKWNVNIDAGYEVRFYVNAIQSVDIGSEVVTPPVSSDTIGVYARTFQRTISDFALAGPYLALNIRF